MFEKIRKNNAPKRDKMLLVAILLALALLAAVLPPVISALRGSYRYHAFELAFSNSLVSARSEGGIEYTAADGKTNPIPADNVSAAFSELAKHGLGQRLRQVPAAEHVTVALPDGTRLSFYNTPEAREDGTESGTTVLYEDPQGKAFLYLQRDTDYVLLVRLLET